MLQRIKEVQVKVVAKTHTESGNKKYMCICAGGCGGCTPKGWVEGAWWVQGEFSSSWQTNCRSYFYNALHASGSCNCLRDIFQITWKYAKIAAQPTAGRGKGRARLARWRVESCTNFAQRTTTRWLEWNRAGLCVVLSIVNALCCCCSYCCCCYYCCSCCYWLQFLIA